VIPTVLEVDRIAGPADFIALGIEVQYADALARGVAYLHERQANIRERRRGNAEQNQTAEERGEELVQGRPLYSERILTF
jgi:hypothetical protein